MAAKNAVILKHNENRGKGRALKTGLDYIYSKFSADCVVVTVDADGQHSQMMWKESAKKQKIMQAV